MRKIFLSVILALCLAVSILPVMASAADSGSLGNDVTWTLSSEGVLTVSGTGKTADYELEYSFGTFTGCTSPLWTHAASIKSIIIEDGVSAIGNAVFYGCHAETVEIADSVSSIGRFAFGDCDNLSSVVIPDSVNNIYSKAFVGCASLKEVKLSKNWNDMGPYGYDTAYNAGFGDPLYASPFAECPAITEIVIPEGITSVLDYAFEDMENLQKVTLPGSLTRIGSNAFSKCVALKEIELPSNLTEICWKAFNECDSLAKVYIPDSVVRIDSEAFANCDELWDVRVSPKWNTLRSGNSTIRSPFVKCPKLISLTIPEGMTAVLDHAFDHADSLQTVTLPGSLTAIGEYAFYKCAKLEEINFPSAVTAIKYNAFNGCAALKEITLPQRLTDIGIFAFSECDGLENVFIPDSVTSIGTSAFSNCENLSSVRVSKNWQLVLCHSGVSTVNTSSPFVSCPKLKEIVLPEGMELIPQYAFQNIDNVPEFSFPQSLKKIGGSAFRNTGLKEITIPAAVTLGEYIGEGSVFAKCTQLEKVIFEDGAELKFIPISCFSGCTSLKSCEIPESVTTICASAFADCAKLESVKLPSNLYGMHGNAFYNCDSLTAISIPDSVTGMGEYIFEDCDKLESVVIGKNVAEIVKGAFKSCDVLKEVVLGDSLTTIPSGCFSDCPALEEIVLPRGIESIGGTAFYNCYNLKKVVCYSALETVGSRAFPYADRTVFYGEAGSPMEKWAQENGFTFVVNTSPVSNISSDKSQLELDEEASERLIVIVEPLGCAGEIVFSSDDPEVVSVDSLGNITALKPGTATVTARCGELSVSCTVQVKGDHVHEYISAVIDPSCTEEGYTIYTCACGESYTGDTVPVAGHKWDEGEITIEPSEEAEGEKTFTCTVCGDKKTEAVPTLDHTHKYSSELTAPTCTEEGYTTHSCDCGESYVGEKVPALGHKWDGGKVTKEPTEEAAGEKTFTCTVCGEVKIEVIDRLPEPEPINNPFKDVAEEDYYFEPVMWAVENGVTSGLSADTFGPAVGCTRAQVVTFLWRAAGEPAPKSSNNPFKDIKEGVYYYDAVLWAVENGITAGLSADAFGPEATCTRGQIVTFLWRANGKPMPESDENPFGDVDESQYYYDAVLWAVEEEITAGMSAVSFAPEATCTRGQIVTFLYRAYK